MSLLKLLFLRHCVPYRRFISTKFGIEGVRKLDIPTEIYGDFNVHYMLYDQNGMVQKGCKTLLEALNVRKQTRYGISVLYD